MRLILAAGTDPSFSCHVNGENSIYDGYQVITTRKPKPCP